MVKATSSTDRRRFRLSRRSKALRTTVSSSRPQPSEPLTTLSTSGATSVPVLLRTRRRSCDHAPDTLVSAITTGVVATAVLDLLIFVILKMAICREADVGFASDPNECCPGTIAGACVYESRLCGPE